MRLDSTRRFDPDQDPEPHADPAVVAALAKWRDSELRAAESSLAAGAECPSAAEVAAFADLSLTVPWRRAALARHLMACPHCAVLHLRVLAGEAAPPVVRAAGRHLDWRHVAAAALLVGLTALVAGKIAARPPAAVRVAWVDAHGLAMRGAENLAATRRILARSPAAGELALIRVGPGGNEVVVEPIDGAANMVTVAANEDVVLPLDRSLTPARDATFVVLHSTTSLRELSSKELAVLAVQALRGVPLPGGTTAYLRLH